MTSFSKITVTENSLEEINSQTNALKSFQRLKEITDAQYDDYGATDVLAGWLNFELTGKQPIRVNKSRQDRSVCFDKGNNVLIVTRGTGASYNYVVFDNFPITVEEILRDPEKYWRVANQREGH